MCARCKYVLLVFTLTYINLRVREQLDGGKSASLSVLLLLQNVFGRLVRVHIDRSDGPSGFDRSIELPNSTGNTKLVVVLADLLGFGYRVNDILLVELVGHPGKVVVGHGI